MVLHIATHRDGMNYNKSGPVKTGPTGVVDTPLHRLCDHHLALIFLL